MLRFISLTGMVVALIVSAGCASHTGSSLGVSLGSGPGWVPSTPESALVISAPDGATWQESANDRRRPLTVGLSLPEGAIVETGRAGGVELELPGGGGTMTLTSQSRVMLNELNPDEGYEIWVSRGRVEGGLTGGSLTLMNACGAMVELTPQPGMTAPYSFGSTLPGELFDAMIGLRLNPDMMLPPLPSEALLGQVPRTFVAPVPVVIPEPHPAALAALGSAAVGLGMGLARRRSAGG